MNIKILNEDMGFGAILELAESLGWMDTWGSADKGTWGPCEADGCEEDALDHLADNGLWVLEWQPDGTLIRRN